MSDGKDPTRMRTGRNGGLAGWANLNTQERHARMAAVRVHSPANDADWVNKLRLTPTA
jgi:hypothetical protein